MLRHLVVFLVLLAGKAQAADQIRMAVTTSFHNSGLADVLLPEIRADLDLEVQLLVVGTGQALRLGRAGDVDAILVHSRAAEETFVADGFGMHRREIMYNDFVVVGPTDDPADVAMAMNAIDALTRVADAEVRFVSRGDDSGTHKKEVTLWEAIGGVPDAVWYNEVGAGMGAALNTAVGLGAYILADRASWLNFGNKDGLQLLYAGDPVLFNQYTFLAVNPGTHAHVKADLAATLENWLTSDRARDLIDSYEIDGETLFVFNAQPRSD
ncbi:MAG: substrate-binding domain-containing protein [Pseudomonadota bacterium]